MFYHSEHFAENEIDGNDLVKALVVNIVDVVA